jgi:glycosyltransferase involved in cell wall biosynthesis
MKIAYIAAGAAGMYCGTCLHDNTLAAALLKQGSQVALIPTYTPIRTDETDVSLPQIFYGGINVYLQQRSSFFRNKHRLLDKFLDHPVLLNSLSWLASSTNAKELGALTVSVLEGEDGNQKKELTKLVSWLKTSFRPDIVNLTNSMFTGFVRQLKKELNVPILCALQGEDLFLEDLIEPYKTQAFEILWERCRDVDGFISPSGYYRDFMAKYLKVPPEKIHVVPLGINLNGYGKTGSLKESPFVIGYLARICPEKGLHVLVQAFHSLVQKYGPEKLRLTVAGYVSKKDQPYFRKIQDQLRKWQIEGQVSFLQDIDRKQKIDFLGSIHALSVPAVYPEPKGIYILEALAHGVPVVQPRHGAFPELLERTGGGILVEPDSSEALAEGLATLMNDTPLRMKLGEQGRAAVHAHYSDEISAEETLKVYQRYVG